LKIRVGYRSHNKTTSCLRTGQSTPKVKNRFFYQKRMARSTIRNLSISDLREKVRDNQGTLTTSIVRKNRWTGRKRDLRLGHGPYGNPIIGGTSENGGKRAILKKVNKGDNLGGYGPLRERVRSRTKSESEEEKMWTSGEVPQKRPSDPYRNPRGGKKAIQATSW